MAYQIPNKRFIVVYAHGTDDTTIGHLGLVFTSQDAAATTVGGYLREKHEVPASEADAVVDMLRRAELNKDEVDLDPTGSIVFHHRTGLNFRILEAHFTSDGKAITPGLLVEDYDREMGTVVKRQFMTGYSTDPGGLYFNGWYAVEKDSGVVRDFNGERLRSI